MVEDKNLAPKVTTGSFIIFTVTVGIMVLLASYLVVIVNRRRYTKAVLVPPIKTVNQFDAVEVQEDVPSIDD